MKHACNERSHFTLLLCFLSEIFCKRIRTACMRPPQKLPSSSTKSLEFFLVCFLSLAFYRNVCVLYAFIRLNYYVRIAFQFSPQWRTSKSPKAGKSIFLSLSPALSSVNAVSGIPCWLDSSRLNCRDDPTPHIEFSGCTKVMGTRFAFLFPLVLS